MNRPSKVKLTIAYDGTDYHGWQIQPGPQTVQGCLCRAAQALLRLEVHVQGASRTDRGVHAQGQVGVLETCSVLDPDHLALGLNGRLPRDIVVLKAERARASFDVVRDATQKHYRYTICTSRMCPPRLARFCWHVPASLDAEAMQAAGQHLLGTHDFRSFAISLDTRQNTLRSISRCQVSRASDQDMTHIDIEGPGFLHHMARIIVGTLVDTGRGHWRPGEIVNILGARNRRAAGRLAPARGLCLERIEYGEPNDRTQRQ